MADSNVALGSTGQGQVTRDANFLSSVVSAIRPASAYGVQRLMTNSERPLLNRLQSVHELSSFGNTVGRLVTPAAIAAGTLDAFDAYRSDLLNGDSRFTKTTRSVASTAGGLVLGATAATVGTALGISIAPALALGFLAGMAGQAIGQEIVGYFR